MSTRWIGIAAILLCLAVILGAFGAHALRDKLDPYSTMVYDKAVFYHFVHALGLLLVALLGATGVISNSNLIYVCYALLFGTIIFSGSLYLLAVSGMRWLGAITPIGGLAFILGWLYLAVLSFSSSKTGA